jgi:hypothetical protein
MSIQKTDSQVDLIIILNVFTQIDLPVKVIFITLPGDKCHMSVDRVLYPRHPDGRAKQNVGAVYTVFPDGEF